MLTFTGYEGEKGGERREKREEKKTGGKGEREKEGKKMSSHRFMLNYLNIVDEEEKKEKRRKKKLSLKLRSGTYCPAIQYLYYVKRKEYSYFE